MALAQRSAEAPAAEYLQSLRSSANILPELRPWIGQGTAKQWPSYHLLLPLSSEPINRGDG
jgi:hypothetical protein